MVFLRGETQMAVLKKPPRQRKRDIRVGCPFCFEWIPSPSHQPNVYSPEGALGGRCECGAAFVVDETGHSGGLALMDAQVLVCDGDLRGTKLETGRDVDVETRDLVEQVRGRPIRPAGSSYLTPKVWFVRLRTG